MLDEREGKTSHCNDSSGQNQQEHQLQVPFGTSKCAVGPDAATLHAVCTLYRSFVADITGGVLSDANCDL